MLLGQNKDVMFLRKGGILIVGLGGIYRNLALGHA